MRKPVLQKGKQEDKPKWEWENQPYDIRNKDKLDQVFETDWKVAESHVDHYEA